MHGRTRPGSGSAEQLAGADLSSTPLGPVEQWGTELRLTVALAQATRYPVVVLWGPDLVMVYNEAYTALIGDKHPAAFGRPAREVFPEVWDVIGPLLQHVLDGGGATWSQDERMLLDRNGYPEECFFTFSYSPVTDADGRVLGIVDIASETTAQVVDRRRFDLLARLSRALVRLDDPAALGRVVLPLLREYPLDLPGVDLLGLGRGDDPPRDDRIPRVPSACGPGIVTEPVPAGTVAWLPVRSDGGDDTCLGVLLSDHLPLDGAYREFLELLADTVGAAESRARVHVAERSQMDVARRMSEELQRAMLTDLPQAERLDLCARYEPAVHSEQIGGDWYDVVLLPDGSSVLVVGDVVGHDSTAAATMGQLRAMSRSLAWTLQESPARLLRRVDEAAQGLGLGSLATCLVVRLDPPGPDGSRRLCWSNAGHPPPLLLEPGDGARYLTGTPDLLLGVHPCTERHDDETTMPSGATLLMATDGLMERRDRTLDVGLAALRETALRRAGLPLGGLVDAVIDDMVQREVPDRQFHVDDVVLLAARST